MDSIRYPSEYSSFTLNPPLRLAILASGKGTNFRAIASAITQKMLSASITSLVVNRPNSEAINIANYFSIPTIIHDHRDYLSREEYDKHLLEILNSLDVELVVLAGWMRVLSSSIVNSYNGRLINIHPSLLPSFKGLDAVSNAIKSGVKILGCTVHYVSNDIDAGEIIGQAAICIEEDDTIETITSKIHREEHIILPYSISHVGMRLRSNKSRDNKG